MVATAPATRTDPIASGYREAGRWPAAEPVDASARGRLVRLCDVLEGELVTLTRRLGACHGAARDEAGALAAALAELAASARSEADSAGEEGRTVTDRTARLTALANLAASLEANLERTVELIQSLPRRTIPLLRRSEFADRRRHPRVPVARACSLLLAGWRGPCLTLDLSEGGALVRPLEPWPAFDDVTGLTELELEGVGRLPSLLVGRSPAGLHLAFRMTAPAARAALAEVLRAARRRERALVATARRIADDLLSWHLGRDRRAADPGLAVAEAAPDAADILDLHLAHEPSLALVRFWDSDGRLLAERAAAGPHPPEEVAPAPPLKGAPQARILLGEPDDGRTAAWLRVELAVDDAVRTLGTVCLYARA